DVRPVAADVTQWDDEEAGRLVGDADLLVAATDSFAAQSWANRIALRYRIPAIWSGLYAGGLGGEVVLWRPGLPCYRCLLPGRYRAQERARAEGRRLDPPSDGTTIFDDGYIDTIAGPLAVGLLTERGKYADLVRALGDRNFLHIKLHPA